MGATPERRNAPGEGRSAGSTPTKANETESQSNALVLSLSRSGVVILAAELERLLTELRDDITSGKWRPRR